MSRHHAPSCAGFTHKVAICLFLLFSSLTLCAQMLGGIELVTPSLHFSSTTFSTPQTVAIRFKIAPGWHLYWKNPGDAGIPIEASWTLPEGYRVSELRFPVPHKIVDAGIVAYGYEEEVALLATLSPPTTGESVKNPERIGVSLSWLVCRENCIPGEATLSINPNDISPSALKEGQAIVSRFEAEMPRPLSESGVKETLLVSKKDNKLGIELRFSGSSANDISDFFPESFSDFTLDYIDITVQRGIVRFTLRPNDANAALQRISGLVLFGKTGYTLETEVSTVSGSSGSALLEQDFSNAGDTGTLSLWLALGMAFVGGIILNVMPCVLPVLSLKVLSMVENAGASREKSAQHGLFFTLGVLVSFWALAVALILLQQAGEAVGWGFQFQTPEFVIAMTVVVFLFGLNMVGVFEISAPAISGKAGASLSRKDAIGAFSNGVLATTLATPCTAPFLGPAVGFAFSQPGGIIVLIFSLVGLGLAVPYVLLSLKPEWLRFIPKPGQWMNTFKQIMGFLLFATAVWLLSVLGAQIGAEGVVATLLFLLGIAISMWMIGTWGSPYQSGTGRRIAWISALLFAAMSYYISFERVFPLSERLKDSPVGEVGRHSISSGGIEWIPFTVNTVETAVSSGKTVFIDFTADWCFTCKVTEKTVIETEPIRSAFRELDIVPIRADWTNRNPEITALLKKFNRSGVPLYVIFPAGQLDSPLVLPEVITTDLLLEALHSAAGRSKPKG